ncbi:MAG: cobyrinate a,c-diamide synthase [Pikeienuella sp.]
MSAHALVISAAASGAGKTVATLGLLRALRRDGHAVSGAKSGPDYIDPQFHAAACDERSVNLDAWAMCPSALRARAHAGAGSSSLLIVEGAMGILDGARPDGVGSAADLAATLGAPVVLVLDVAGSAQSAALAPMGLARLRPDVALAGAIVNRAASKAHGEMARTALERAGIRVFGVLPRSAELTLPARHLGLVLAEEHPDLPRFLDGAADLVAAHLDLPGLVSAAAPIGLGGPFCTLAPLGNRIAVARDAAFAFVYPHMLDDWQAQGAAILTFSPLSDEGPDPTADAVFLPGGYPELWAGRLAAAERFRAGMRSAAARGALIYGECGGYMALGHGLEDAAGCRHRMLGLLPVSTSFAQRRLSLGYRRLDALPGAPWRGSLMAHEFHYATITDEVTDQEPAPALFAAADAAHRPLDRIGHRLGRVSGSFAHVIGPAPAR